MSTATAAANVRHFTRYPKYKDSGIEWLGEIPEGWETVECKLGYSIQLGKMLQNEPQAVDDEKVPYLKALNVQWENVDVSDLPEMWAGTTDIVKYSVRDGDLLVCEGGEVGRTGILLNPPEKCIIQNALHRVRPKRGNSNKYLMYMLEVASFQGWFDILCNKATIAHFTGDKFGCFSIVLPTAEEQNNIASFLDRETERIDSLISKKQRQIELLQEKRSALISHTVTKGLDPKVKMKDSGIEWLGDIPETWEVKKLKFVARLQSGDSITSNDIYDSGNYPVYGGNGLRGYTADYTHEGDFVLIGRQGALCGCINYAKGKFWASEHAVVAAPNGPIIVDWLGELLRSMNLNQYSQSAAQPGLAVDRISTLDIPVPPFDEQTVIASFLDHETSRIDAIIEKVKTSIEKLREYRSALISAAVTGKIDVREETA